jgi:hypothetical protein
MEGVNFKIHDCQGVIFRQGYAFTIQGKCPAKSGWVTYTASAPPDVRTSLAGSGLPFPNEMVAYENSPNSGRVPIQDGVFSFTVMYPNSYYHSNGAELIRPHVIFVINNEYYDVGLGKNNYVKHKSLTSLPPVSYHTRATGR